MDKKGEKFFTLLKATRAYRVLPTLMVILVSASFANFINKEIILLGLVATLIYSASGIHNALKDKDYFLPEYSRKAILVLLSIALILSLSNKIIFFTAVVAIFLGIIYNTISRKILLGDSTVLAITHYALPCFSASLLLGLDMKLIWLLTGSLFLIGWFIIPSKNLKDLIGDKKRKYVTLPVKFSKGTSITKLFVIISFIFMFIFYFLFDLSNIFILFLIVLFFLLMGTLKQINKKNYLCALNLLRFAVLIFMFGIILGNLFNLHIFLSSLSILFLYLIYYFSRKKGI
jgi:4-hydroxybenzoate polyprenyltransferase